MISLIIMDICYPFSKSRCRNPGLMRGVTRISGVINFISSVSSRPNYRAQITSALVKEFFAVGSRWQQRFLVGGIPFAPKKNSTTFKRITDLFPAYALLIASSSSLLVAFPPPFSLTPPFSLLNSDSFLS